MYKMNSKLGPYEIQFFSWIQLKNREKIESGEISAALNINKKQENKLLSRLSKTGLIIRLCRGIYLVPEKIPPGGKWMPDEYYINFQLMKYYNADYQIGGPSVYNYYGLDEQIPNSLYIYNNKISGERKIGNIIFRYIEIPDNRIGGNKKILLKNKTEVIITTLARTLVDSVYDWDRFNTIPKAYEWIIAFIKKSRNNMNELIEIAVKYGNQGTCRRIGYLLESNGVSSVSFNKLKKRIRPSKAFIPFIPGNPVKGRINKNWGLIING